MGCRRFLNLDHRFRRERMAINNQIENGTFTRQRDGVQILEQGRACAEWILAGRAQDSDNDPNKTHGVKSASILYALPYWKVL